MIQEPVCLQMISFCSYLRNTIIFRMERYKKLFFLKKNIEIQLYWLGFRDWFWLDQLYSCISRRYPKGWMGNSSMCLQMKGSQVTTTSSLSLWAFSFNSYSHRGLQNPDNYQTFIPFSLSHWPTKPQTPPIGSMTLLTYVGVDWHTWILPTWLLHIPETAASYFTCTFPPFSQLLHESIHVGVYLQYVLAFSLCLSNMDSLCRVTVVTNFQLLLEAVQINATQMWYFFLAAG